jgi:hypothetical protein
MPCSPDGSEDADARALADMLRSRLTMTRHDLEAWLDHHLDQPVLVERCVLSGGEITSRTSTTGVLRKESGEYLAGDSPIDFTDFAAADFAAQGVIVELGEEVELHIASSV